MIQKKSDSAIALSAHCWACFKSLHVLNCDLSKMVCVPNQVAFSDGIDYFILVL